MRLKEILKEVRTISIRGDAGTEISGISYDSRKVAEGHLFVAIRGDKTDGHHFIGDAVARGAAAVIYDNPEAVTSACITPEERASLCLIRVGDCREAMAYAANNFFMRPSEALTVAGVTGTNGKTTTTYLMKSIIESWGRKAGLIGTIQYMAGDKIYSAPHTTPEAPEFQEMLRTMISSGCTHVAVEVSSHALAQKRVDGTTFRAAVFTNLTRDHLDFHGTMDNYFRTKERLFRELLGSNGFAVINVDDPYGRRLLAGMSGGVRMLTYGLESGSDLRATDIDNSSGGLRFKINVRGRTYGAVSPLMGLPNVYNILAAAGVSACLGVPWRTIIEGIRNSMAVRGRFEKVDAGQGVLAVIDYAHTEDALERLIYTARGLTDGKIVTVFGCGGDRDRGKRFTMGSIATRLSDFVILTSDNPRSESPRQIIEEIEAGATRKNYLVEPDREAAIRRAVLIARENDVVLVAGKGHEEY
ncbi:MAG: UDP-N-acetylmuramoyl-L-alanyl-D-glutamate--2,6-diaminopimelate ligase, partial [Candidatus Sulfobium sp.]